MLKRNTYILIVLVIITTASVTAIATLQRQDALPHNESRNLKQVEIESLPPVAEETAPEPSGLAERAKKREKEKKYNKYKDTIGSGVTTSSVYHHWPPGFPTLPVTQSDAVVMGEVSDAKAYVTSDKSTVYSEFTIRIAEVLKNDNQTSLSSGGLIVAERPGGRVRYSSGHISRFSITGWGLPLIKRQYVLFLTKNNYEDSYRIVTGYELRNGHVFPLDTTTSSETDFDAYVNMDEVSFLNQLRAAITHSHL